MDPSLAIASATSVFPIGRGPTRGRPNGGGEVWVVVDDWDYWCSLPTRVHQSGSKHLLPWIPSSPREAIPSYPSLVVVSLGSKTKGAD